jgi:G:T-mismatch repair DNA endonuclease (very short patch repair protein)
VERDRTTEAAPPEAGWRVIRIWEHDDSTTAADESRELYVAGRLARQFRGALSIVPPQISISEYVWV